MAKENATVLTLYGKGNGTTALGDNFQYVTTPCSFTVLYVTVAPDEDAAGCTVDINDDGSGVITGIDCSDADVPGTWKSKAMGGSDDPVVIAAGSKISADANSAGVSTGITIHIYAVPGTVWS